MSVRDVAESYLKLAINNSAATFRDGQWECIEKLLNNQRVLCVQRTGWGKSMVYFLATKLLRMRGYGPTLLVSPLLSLMRNQVEAANRLGINAVSIDSTNVGEWNNVYAQLDQNQIDILLISPERLGNEKFRENVFKTLRAQFGLFVVDEAHCISDWGHDFRPDYRRIVRVLQSMPPQVPVLATTATANDRVVADIQNQLGEDLVVQRGTLIRKSLKLQNIHLPSTSARLAWLAETVPTLPGSGIIYTLTIRDAERVAEWLQQNGIKAEYYHSKIGNGKDTTSNSRIDLEQKLLKNEIKVLVATVALGMGFDKPDLGFVIHYQCPGSVVNYYQQVGRAGRAVEEAYGILLWGEEDDEITEYFIKNAFPTQNYVSEVLDVLDRTEGSTMAGLLREVNLPKGKVEQVMKFLSSESPSPVVKIDRTYYLTPAAQDYHIDQNRIDAITVIRRNELQQMRDYTRSTECLMSFLQKALDDPNPVPCGKCKNCQGYSLVNEGYNRDLANQAALFLRRNDQPIKPRKQWPDRDCFEESPLNTGKLNIPQEYLCEMGRALSLWGDAGWGEEVAKGKYQDEWFSDDLVTGCVKMLARWKPEPRPEWVCCIPSSNHPTLVPDFARRLAEALGIPFISCISKRKENLPQKKMENSCQQVHNLDGVFEVEDTCLSGPCLLIDDLVDSGWTFTIAGALLRQKGCSAVFPLALAMNHLNGVK